MGRFHHIVLAVGILSACQCSRPGTRVPDSVPAPDTVQDTSPGQVVVDAQAEVSAPDLGNTDIVPDTEHAVDVPDVVTPALGACSTAVGALPKVGEPCDQLGQERCSAEGAMPWKTDPSVCILPNRLKCGSTNGQLVWQLNPCPAPGGQCTGPSGVPSCQENPKGVSCCPAFCQGPSGAGAAQLCDANGAKPICITGTDTVRMCQFVDQTDPEVQAVAKTNLGSCWSTCSTCTYQWVKQRCQTVCPKDPKCLDSQGKCDTKGACVSSTGGVGACAGTCAEEKAAKGK